MVIEKKIQYNNTEIPGHNADLQSIGNLSLGPAKEKNILLEKYQTESIYFLFGTQEQMWQRERNVLQGDGIFAPYLKVSLQAIKEKRVKSTIIWCCIVLRLNILDIQKLIIMIGGHLITHF